MGSFAPCSEVDAPPVSVLSWHCIHLTNLFIYGKVFSKNQQCLVRKKGQKNWLCVFEGWIISEQNLNSTQKLDGKNK